jgi:hypothetical protein
MLFATLLASDRPPQIVLCFTQVPRELFLNETNLVAASDLGDLDMLGHRLPPRKQCRSRRFESRGAISVPVTRVPQHVRIMHTQSAHDGLRPIRLQASIGARVGCA